MGSKVMKIELECKYKIKSRLKYVESSNIR